MTTTRISWIDNAKFIAITCVLLGHSFSLIKGDFCGYDDFNLFIVAFNMPLFALLSGFTSYKSLTRIYTVFDLFSYLNKIAWHLGVPTVIYTLIAMSIGYGMQLRWDRCILSTILLTIVCLLIYLLIFSKYSSKLEKARLFFPYLILPVCLANQSVWYFVYVLFSLFAAALSAYMSTKIRKNKRLLFCICFALISWVFAYFSPFYSTVEFYVPFIVGFIYSNTEVTFGLVTVEAMACGTPAIVLRDTAGEELVDEQTGFVVDKVEEVVQQIPTIKSLNKEQTAKACRQRVQTLFEASKQHQKYIDLYNRLIRK